MSQQKLIIPDPLSALDKSSFAYKTIKDRLPVIIVKTIDFLHRHRQDLHKFGGTINKPNEAEIAEIETDAKEFISHLTKLRKELETNKPAQLVEVIGPDCQFCPSDDVDLWNQALEANKLQDGSLPRWFESPWLLMECYLYRRIKDAALRTRHLKCYDPFVEQKHAACLASISQMNAVARHLLLVEEAIHQSPKGVHPSERSEFGLFVQLALWANKADLSIGGMSADNIQSQNLSSDIRDAIDSLRENILCDNMSEFWFKFQAIKNTLRQRKADATSLEPIYIDLVADNSGYEIFVDLCLLSALSSMLDLSHESNLLKFRIHVKRMPWFVSDTLKVDIDWLLNLMINHDSTDLQRLGKVWEGNLEKEIWEIHADKFWTLPHDYSQMQEVAPELHSTLAKSSLIIFKGDLNYRKLTGDRKWHILTPFRVALRGFAPAPLVALRTAKADVVVGLEDISIFARINNNELPRDWMISGDYGLIQFFDPL